MVVKFSFYTSNSQPIITYKILQVYLRSKIDDWILFSWLKGIQEQIAKVNISNIVCPNQNIDIKIPRGLRACVIVQGTVKIMLNLVIGLKDKTLTITNSGRRVLKKKNILIFISNF